MNPNHPAAARQPGLPQVLILLSCVCFAVLASAIIGPVLPQIEAHFKDVPQVKTLIPIVVTLPMLVLGVLGIVIGAAADRVGRKRMFVAGLGLYAVCGTAPLYLDSLPLILVSRFGVGLAEAAIMTCSTTLIGDYWSGTRRDKYMALQTTFASVSAVIFNTLGGVLGEQGWRAPFGVYGLSLVLLPLVMLYIWDTRRNPQGEAQAAANDAPGLVFNPALVAWTCVTGFLAGVVFMVMPVHLAYMLVDVGTRSPQQIGLAYALNSAGIALGTLVFGWLIVGRLRVAHQFTLAAVIVAAGFWLMGSAQSYASMTVGAVVNGFGCGIMLPAAVTWNMRVLPFARRGVGAGAFLSLHFIGYFVSPLLLMPLVEMLGKRAQAVEVLALAIVGVAVLTLLAGFRRPQAGASRQAFVQGRS
ncbi:MAG TPA: MFS transporter [Ramlibacter sp.]|nr:MFS transporter [Ramlibacter sp.]